MFDFLNLYIYIYVYVRLFEFYGQTFIERTIQAVQKVNTPVYSHRSKSSNRYENITGTRLPGRLNPNKSAETNLHSVVPDDGIQVE